MSIQDITNRVYEEIIASKKPVVSPRVLVLVGLQYAGKSYLAEQIVSRNYAHFWATKIKKEYDLKNSEMIEVATLVLGKALSGRYNIVLDFVNHKYAIRKQFQDASEKSEADYAVVFLDTPKVVRLERRQQNIANGATDGRRIISLEQMEEFESGFEPPKPSEHVIRLVTLDDISDFVNWL